MSTQGVIQFSGKAINQTQLLVSFTLFPGCNAADLGCYIAVWEGAEISASAQVLQKHIVSANENSGELLVEGLSLGAQDYVIGLGLDANAAAETIYCCLEVPVGITPHKSLTALLSNVAVATDDIGSDFLVANIQTPAFDEIKIDKGWIALFPGKYKDSMKEGINVIAISKTTCELHPEKIIMKNIPNGLSRFETYTLVYGVGLNHANQPEYHRMIGTYTFIVWRSKMYIHTYIDLPLFPTLCLF